MRLKEFEIFESATAVATSSGNIAAVVNPHVAHNNTKTKKKWKPTDNALDMKGEEGMLLASKDPATIRRQIQEGSLYVGPDRRKVDLGGNRRKTDKPTPIPFAKKVKEDEEDSLYEGLPLIAAGLAALAGGYAGYKKLKGKDDEGTPPAAKKKNIFQKRHDDIEKAVKNAHDG